MNDVHKPTTKEVIKQIQEATYVRAKFAVDHGAIGWNERELVGATKKCSGPACPCQTAQAEP